MKTSLLSRCAIVSFGVLLTVTGCATHKTGTADARSPMIVSNSTWRLTQLAEEPVVTPANGRDVQFTLDYSNRKIAGDAGCNRFFGRYEMNGDAIRFSDIGSTKMFCDGRMDVEQGFLAMLGEAASWKISDKTLQLFDASGKALATFKGP